MSPQAPPGPVNEMEPPTSPASSFIPTPSRTGPVTEMVVFFAFIMIRAIHPIVIDGSKTLDEDTGKKGLLYQNSSVVIVQGFLLAGVSQLQTFVVGGRALYASIWQPQSLRLFFIIGFIYALGDYLEMLSMGSLSGAAYQILLQSKIIVTASLVMCVRGVFQTRLQWIILFILMFSMSAYMVIASGGSGKGEDARLMGMVFAFLKVLVSCSAAVLADKYIKAYKDDPPVVHLAQTWFGVVVSSVLLSFTSDVWLNGFFSGWDMRTGAVVVSFFVKSYSSLVIVALLDAILKNIGESLSVLVIYSYDVLAPWVDKTFDTATFLSVVVVVAACAAYVDSKAPIEKAALYDKSQQVDRI
mmetsp:Transcript_143434/g.275479  ORF Transcript_143434/g.275479 Transcript_143434/m.275479 type:complete len:356 (-) Transcript_143434:136-1203(-)